MSRRARLASLALAWAAAAGPAAGGWLEVAEWRAAPAPGVELALAGETDARGAPVLRLDFDFHGHGGWAAAGRPFAVALPANWELRLRLRGDGPANDLEIKFVDASGDNVWWSVRRGFAFPREWTTVSVRKRDVAFAWGPAGAGAPLVPARLELAVTAGEGGRGTLRIGGLELVPLPPERPYAGTPVASAAGGLPSHAAALALDGRAETAWRPPGGPAAFLLDFGEPREFGGLSLLWEEGRIPSDFAVDFADDGETWTEVRRVARGGARRSDLLLPDSRARWLRLRLSADHGEVGLAELEVLPRETGASPASFFAALARAAPRGTYPRAISGEQVYWTVVGAGDGDDAEALVSEDGAVEVGERGFSIEPFVRLDGGLWSWADVASGHSLADGDLPIPTVTWPLPGLALETTVLATGEAGRSTLLVRYRLRATGGERRAGELFVAVRPFQVNPPTQFLNVAGGVAPLAALACAGRTLLVGDRPRLFVAPAPSACGAAGFDEGPLPGLLAAGGVPPRPSVAAAFPYASAALAWSFDLAPGAERTVVVAAPFHADDTAARALASATGPEARFASALAAERSRWRAAVDRVAFELPAAAARLVAVARSSLAFVLVHRDGPALQPGSRSYARSWIRDGALTGDALLRLGHAAEARAFVEWYAGFQAADGRIPCCIDRRGADPVPEHDSHGEFLHLVREVFRYTGDRAFAERLLPAVARTVAAIDALRAERRTDDYRGEARRELFGLLPESISHEGYSAKPRHSYWDDAFAYRGLDDAVALARDLGHDDLAARWAASRDEFRADLLASIEATRARHGIAYLPGCAELGDLDPTSATVLLEPGGLQSALPAAAVDATFAAAWRELVARRDGTADWEAYTPYELRDVGAFVRLGWRERAQEMLRFFLDHGLRPPEWNGWAEVVGRAPRAPRFLGDLPHGWVASDYLRSFLDLFALERRDDGALVLAAGVPREWLAGGETVGVRGLRTPWGLLSYRLYRADGRLIAEIDALERRPPGGVRLALPLAPGPAAASVDGVATALTADGELALAGLPARVEVTEGPQ